MSYGGRSRRRGEDRGEFWKKTYRRQMDNVQDLILNSSINLPNTVEQIPRGYGTEDNDKPPIIHVAETLDAMLAVLNKWEYDKQEEEKSKPRGRLYTSIFTIATTDMVVHIDFEDQADDKNIPAGAVIHRPFRKVHTITLINKGAGTVKIQTNDTAENEGGMNTEIEGNETMVIDCTDFRGRPIVEDLNIAVTSGSTASIKVIAWA